MKKKRFKLGLMIIVMVFVLTGCNSNNYNKGLEYFNAGDYEQAEKCFSKISKDYKDAKKYQDKLEEYKNTYSMALKNIEDGEYNNSKALLKKLPENYKIAGVLLQGIDNLEALLTYTWVDDSEDSQGWSYYDDFYIETSGTDISLYNHQEEYNLGEYLGEYTDTVNLEELLKEGKTHINSSDRDDYTIIIKKLITDGYYEHNTDYINSKFVVDGEKDPVETSEKYNDTEVKQMYDYILEHKNNVNLLTYKYLKELKKVNYKDTVEIYNILYSYKLECLVNHSENDNTTSEPTHEPFEQYSFADSYFHIKVSGGHPGEKTVPIMVSGRSLYQGIWCEGSMNSSGGIYDDPVELNKWECVANLPLSDSTSKSEVTVVIKNIDGTELKSTMASYVK